MALAMLPYIYEKDWRDLLRDCASCCLPCDREEAAKLVKVLCVLSHPDPAWPTSFQLLKVYQVSHLDCWCSQWREVDVHVGQVISFDD